MRTTIKFLHHEKRRNEKNVAFEHEIALYDEKKQHIASKYGFYVTEEMKEDIEDLIQWAFVHGRYERTLEIMRLLKDLAL